MKQPLGMFNLSVEILKTIFLLACFSSVQVASQGSPKSAKECDHQVLTDKTGIIKSPNYGLKYPINLDCKWTIKAPVDMKISLYFKDFVIEKSSSCSRDYLLVYDGEDKNARLVGRYCHAKPVPFTSSSNYIHVQFVTDLSLGYRGFYATYNITSPTTEKPTTWKSRPQFKNVVLNKTAVVGDLVRLQCEVDGTPEPGITWTKDSQNVAPDNNVFIKKTSFKSELTIQKVSKIDQGKYSCKASNGFGPPIEAYGSLDVEERKFPLITNVTQRQMVFIGQKILLKCEAKGQTPMNISLNKNNERLKTRKCNENDGCQIQLTTKRFEEDTVIACNVTNSVGHTGRNIHIKVRGPPVIIDAPKNQTVQRGSGLNLTCAALGKNITFSWLKDKEKISYGVVSRGNRSVLKLDSVKQNTTLTCRVEGQHGVTSKNALVSITKKGKKKPAKRIELKISSFPNRALNYNESVSVHCSVTGHPRPIILSWKVNDSVRSEISKASNVLTIKLLSLNRTVSVFCNASNKYETICSRVTITVKESEPVKGHREYKSSTMNDNIKLILGAGGGVLVLTGVIILFIFLRWKRNKKIEKTKQLPSTEATAAREQENLIPNPIYNNNCSKETEVDTKPGVEMLHYPRDSIEQTEILEDGRDIEMFLGRATDLPFSPGEFSVVVRALKNTDPSETIKDDFDIEASLLANLVHPNVVRLMAVCIKTTPLCLVFEYSSYGYLDEYLQKCDQSELSNHKEKAKPVDLDSPELALVDRLLMAKQIASGMKYLATKGYVHQELRARNCLVFKDMQVKVANLGLHWAKDDQNFFVMEPEEKQRFPVRWLPPEVVLYGEYSHSADVWSYGVLVWEIFSNAHLPYMGISDNDVVSYVRGSNVLPRPKLCPHEVYEVMKSCWEITPLERPDFKSLQETLAALHAGVPV